MSKFLSNPHLTSSWTITSQGMSADGDDDQRRLDAFLRANPDIRQAVLHSIRYGVPNGQNTVNIEPNFNSACGSEPITLPTEVLPPKDAATPGKPHRFVSAIEKFIEGRDDSDVKARTTEDIASVVRNFAKFLAANHPDMGENPWVHQVDSTHLSDFIDAEKKRSGRYKDEGGKSRGIKAATLKKRLLDLRTFFRFAHKRLKACTTNPVGDLEDRVADLGRLASKTTNHYAPFTDDHLRLIFQPEEYLAHNRAPDYFWCPLLAAHLGGRLGEFVLATVDDVGQDAHGVWCLTVRESIAKNENSARTIPLTQPLIDLGFLEYVDYIRQLGATQLWPHRDFSSPTAERLPTKNQSNAFGDYLTKRGLVSPSLVYHSFRHTVITALLDAGTPVHVSMQLCGHEAQEAAIKRGLITELQARSVHLDNYAHADSPRLGNSSPLLNLKTALEKAVLLPIEYPRLRTAARIVLQHTRKTANGFETGWPAQRTKYTETQILRLGNRNSCDSNGLSNQSTTRPQT